MTKGEQYLRRDIHLALETIRAIGDPDQINDYVDAAIEAVKKQWIYVQCGYIQQVEWDNPQDWRDNSVCYSLWAEQPEDEWDDEELEDEDLD